MQKVPDGTIVVYLDSGAYFKTDITPLVNTSRRYGRLFFNNFHDNTKYCKCYPVQEVLPNNPTKQQKFWKSLQLDASCMLISNTSENKRFIQQWLDWCLDFNFVSDSETDKCKNQPGFRDHRHDQALLSLCAFINPKGQKFESLATKYYYIKHHRRRHL